MAVNSTQNIAENRERFAKYFTNKDKDAFSMENFFNLLMAEMSNQDPLEPMSNTEFIGNLANFTALKAQQDALYYQNANYAQSLVGKTVTVPDFTATSGVRFTSGIVTSMNVTDGDFSIKVNGKDHPLSNIMEILPTHNPYTIVGSEGAYAASLIGMKVTVVGTDDVGRRITETGIVTRFEVRDNEISIIIKDLAYPLSSVLRVEAADSKGPGEEDDDWSGEGEANAPPASNPPPANDPDPDTPDTYGSYVNQYSDLIY
jgi:flagellar basal-body rod modification protein FlgD